MRQVEVIQGQASPERLEVSARSILGRGRDADLRLFDERASRQHAEITIDDERARIRDLGSANGTFLNGERIGADAVLFDGDVIQIGSVELRYTSGDGADRDTVVRSEEDVEEALDPEAADPTRDGADSAAVRRLRLVCDGAAACADAAEPDEIPAILLGLIVETLAPDRATISLRRPDGKMEVAAAHPPDAGPPVSRTLRRRVLEQGEAVLIRDAHDEDVRSSASIIRSRYRSTLAAPLVTAEGALGFIAVEAIDPGAYAAPDLRALAATARQAALALRTLVRLSGARAEIRRLAEEQTVGAPTILGVSAQMDAIREQIRKSAEAESSVLISGETGTGKELVARRLHVEGPRRDKPFVALNCAALVEGLLESELFGHEQGAFTDARERREGRIAQAEDGTLFLDEVGELSPALQAKLLRVLSERKFTRVGGRDVQEMRCRVIAATNRDLKAMVKEGTFREDLYYRMAVLVIDVAPLRERREDIEVLADAGLERLAARLGRRVPRLGQEARETLTAYPWPGNVRELFNVLERALVLLEGDSLTADHLPREVREPPEHVEDQGAEAATSGEVVFNLRELERRAVKAALEETGGKKGAAAALLGVSWPTLNRKIRQYGL